jgi:hypothetical protein
MSEQPSLFTSKIVRCAEFDILSSRSRFVTQQPHQTLPRASRHVADKPGSRWRRQLLEPRSESHPKGCWYSDSNPSSPPVDGNHSRSDVPILSIKREIDNRDSTYSQILAMIIAKFRHVTYPGFGHGKLHELFS